MRGREARSGNPVQTLPPVCLRSAGLGLGLHVHRDTPLGGAMTCRGRGRRPCERERRASTVRRHTPRGRDSGLRLVSKVTKWIAGATVGLMGGFVLLFAHAGHPAASTAAATPVGASVGVPTTAAPAPPPSDPATTPTLPAQTSAPTATAAPTPPSRVPATVPPRVSTHRPVVTSGGS